MWYVVEEIFFCYFIESKLYLTKWMDTQQRAPIKIIVCCGCQFLPDIRFAIKVWPAKKRKEGEKKVEIKRLNRDSLNDPVEFSNSPKKLYTMCKPNKR